MRNLLIACAAACAALSPALASGSAGGSFTAIDNQWLANGGPGNELTIAPGETVTFGYPSGGNMHNVFFEDPQPSSCQGVQPADATSGWQGSCRFDAAGTYAFVCGYHPTMTGRVLVRAAPTPTPTSTATATPTTVPGASPSPPPAPTTSPGPGATPQTALKVTLARNQRAMRVRGAVEVEKAGARLEVTARTTRRVGRFLRRSTGAGTVVFSVGLDKKARRTLRTKGRLSVTVTIALTPPGGKKLTRTAKTTLTRG